ncbi:unnamed protein product [Larinioides sclopetarius]|uniref:Uncharacterized protein n=1 Tax=Larinioides sclopetarius TaxID=280406 RepID=A0AAV1YZ18_9ARAC
MKSESQRVKQAKPNLTGCCASRRNLLIGKEEKKRFTCLCLSCANLIKSYGFIFMQLPTNDKIIIEELSE